MIHVTYVNESCHAHEWVMSQIRISRVTDCLWGLPVSHHAVFNKYEWVRWFIHAACHTYEWVMSHIWTSHVTHMNEWCYTLPLTAASIASCCMSHTWTSHVTHMKESCHTYAWVMSYMSICQVTLMNSSCHTFEWVLSYMCMSNVAHLNEPCHTYEWVRYTFMLRVTRVDVSCYTLPLGSLQLVCLNIYVYVQTQTHIHTHAHAHTRTHTTTNTLIYVFEDAHIYTSMYTHINMTAGELNVSIDKRQVFHRANTQLESISSKKHLCCETLHCFVYTQISPFQHSLWVHPQGCSALAVGFERIP